VSVGVKGARIGVGADGRVRSSVGIPGTGISYQHTHSMGHGAPPSSYGQQTGPGVYAPHPVQRSGTNWPVIIVLVVGLGAFIAIFFAAVIFLFTR
jgi:hypothetical protein